MKLLYLAIHNARLRWRTPVEWTAAMGVNDSSVVSVAVASFPRHGPVVSPV
jgi:hypothetical protein